MNTHPYVRAYMAGIFVPSIVLLLGLTVFIMVRIVLQVPVPIERVIIFPMAVVPTAFGLWNILYVWSRPHRSWPIGVHGAVLPFLLLTLGVVTATSGGFLTVGAHGVVWFHAIDVPYLLVVPSFFCLVAIYYLVWKYVVGFFNRMLGIA